MTTHKTDSSLHEPLLNKATANGEGANDSAYANGGTGNNNGSSSSRDEETGLQGQPEVFVNEAVADELADATNESSWLLGKKYRTTSFVIAALDFVYLIVVVSLAMHYAVSWNMLHVVDVVVTTALRTKWIMYQSARCKSQAAAKGAAYAALFCFLYGFSKFCCTRNLAFVSWMGFLLMGNLVFCVTECILANLVASYSTTTVDDASHTAAAPTQTTQGLYVTGDEAKSIGPWQLLKVLKPYFWPTGTVNRACVVATWGFLLMAKAANILAPLFMAKATDDLTRKSGGGTVLITGHIVAYAVLLFANKALNEAQNMAYIRVKLIAGQQIKEQVFAHLLSLSMEWHYRKSTGTVVTALQRGITASNMVVQYIFLYLLPTAGEAVVVAVVFVQTFGAPALAAVAVVGCTLYVVVTIELTIWRMQFRKKMNMADNDASHKMTDALLNIETVKCFTAERAELARYRESVHIFQDQAYKIQGSLSLLNTAQQFVLNATLIAALLVAAHEYNRHEFTVGQFVAVNVYVMQLFAPLNFLGSIYGATVGSYVDLENLCNILAEQPDIADRAGAYNLPVPAAADTTTPTAPSTTALATPSEENPNSATTTVARSPSRALDVEFRNVHFFYPSRPQVPVLKNVSFLVPAGTTTAIVGETGSGKSSLTRLLFRYYEAAQGQVLLGGHDVLNLTQKSLRRTLGMVPQDHSLFNDTLRYNIAYGRVADHHFEEDNDAAESGNTDSDIDEAIRKASAAAELDSFVSQWPDGLDTVVGERGQQLSGGQKQRIAIARVLVKDAPVVVLDEATSSLDSRTEEKIQSALESLGAGRTMIVIAHRLSTIQNADQIIVMSKGEVLERGTHETLIAKGPWHERCYASLWDKQKRVE